MKKQQQLNQYFSTRWHGNPENFKWTGPALILKVKPEENVIDVGCGRNYFKGKIPNLIGIDPAFDQADIKITIEEFQTPELFDVAFCLGSINIGDEVDIENKIRKVNSLLKEKARIYWRCNPGLQDHANEECKQINFFPWTEEYINHFALMFGFRVTEMCLDVERSEQGRKRLYAEWTRD